MFRFSIRFISAAGLLAAFLLINIGGHGGLIATSSAATLSQISSAYHQGLTDEQRQRLQEMLVWSGHYQGMIDGQIGPMPSTPSRPSSAH